MKRIYFLPVLLLLLFSCGNEPELSKNELFPYFYPYDSIPKVYCYRDVVNGLQEKFHRVYGMEDSRGKHIVVEMYSEDGRIIEAYNYNVDSLRLIDHMVVNRDGIKIQAQVMKNALFPMNTREHTWFASKFPGVLDSTLILTETKRSVFSQQPVQWEVLGEKKPTIVMLDSLRFTVFNPFTKRENETNGIVKSYFSEGVGLVRTHDLDLQVDFRLEKIMTQEEWVKMMNR